MVVVASIPHTGTSFVFHEILKGFDEGRNPLKNPDAKVWIHIYAERMPELLSLYGWPWIVPLRHPYLVASTWKGRQKDLGELKDFWERLVTQVAPHDPLYFAIDSDARYRQLTAIADRLCIQVDTSWPVIASHGLREPLQEHERAMFAPYLDFYEHHCAG